MRVPRPVLSIVLGAAVVGLVLGVSPNFRWSTDHERNPFAGDFLHEWTGAWIVRHGDVHRLYDFAYADALQHDRMLVGFPLRHDGFLPLVYPPVWFLALSPLADLSYRMAAWLWVALSLAAFAATVLLLVVALTPGGALDRVLPPPDDRHRRPRRLAGIVALPLAIAFVPFAENLVAGQKATLILLVYTVTLLALQRGHDLLAGLSFGLLAIKPQVAFVVPLALLAKGRTRFALGVAATAAALAAASLALGLDVARSYAVLATTLPEQIRFGPQQLHRIHGAYGFFTLLGGGATWPVRAATLAVVVLVVVLVARLLRGPLDPSSRRFVVQWAGLVVATVLLAPNVLTYDLTILLLPMFLLGTLLLRDAIAPGLRRGVLWTLVALYVVCGASPSIAARTSIQLTMPALAMVLVFLARLTEPEAALPRIETPARDEAWTRPSAIEAPSAH